MRFTFLMGLWIAAWVVPAAAEDCLDRLASGIERFRGLGDPDVTSYQVEVRLPDDEEETVPLHELWRSPRDLVIRAAKPGTHRAIVRSLALYLEPLYVARTSLLDSDWRGYAEELRSDSRIRCSREADGELVTVALPDSVLDSPDLPETFTDLREFSACLDSFGRLAHLRVTFRDGSESETLTLECEYDGKGERTQPDVAVWTLPGEERVEIRTTFGEHEGRILPDSRTIVFPSRYDPGETEEIFVRYADYRIDLEIPDELLTGPDAFRYDVSGLVTE